MILMEDTMDALMDTVMVMDISMVTDILMITTIIIMNTPKSTFLLESNRLGEISSWKTFVS